MAHIIGIAGEFQQNRADTIAIETPSSAAEPAK